MGPYASLDFYRMILERSAGRANSQFPHILLSNLPVPDFVQDRTYEEEAVHMVEEEARTLEKAGADFLVIICNTMHVYIERFRGAVSIPILSMIDVVAEHILAEGLDTVGILASPTTIATRLYQDTLERYGVKTLIPDKHDQGRIAQTIFHVIAGQSDQTDVECVLHIAQGLLDEGAKAILLGCTELPLLMRNAQHAFPCVASSEVLANAVHTAWRQSNA